MKQLGAVISLCFCLAMGLQARCTTLPDSCGDDSVKFDVKTEKNPQPLAGPVEGKARIVLIEDENAKLDSLHYALVRYGMDGAWVGATYGDSYFTLDVQPGVHHLCADVQASAMWLGEFKRAVGMATFTAEPGKVYYFSSSMIVTYNGGRSFDFGFSAIDEDDGKYRVKAGKLATWQTKK
jgi:hypothetical protein